MTKTNQANPPEKKESGHHLSKEEKERLNVAYEALANNLRLVYGKNAHSIVIHAHSKKAHGTMSITMTLLDYRGNVLPPLRGKPDPFDLMKEALQIVGNGHWRLPKALQPENKDIKENSRTPRKTQKSADQKQQKERPNSQTNIPSITENDSTPPQLFSPSTDQPREATPQHPTDRPTTQNAATVPATEKTNTRNREVMMSKIKRDRDIKT